MKKHLSDSRGVRFLPMCCMLAVIFASASMSGKTIIFLNSLHLDKILHALAYAALAGSCYIALRPNRTGKQIRTSLLVIAICLFSGIMEEIYQHFIPNRVMDHKDVVADMIGTLAVVAFHHLHHFFLARD